jgi:hypothetical protein
MLNRISGKVHAVLDRRTREVHINPATDLSGQRAFKRLHETSHDLFPWQHIDDGCMGFADNEMTLSPKTTILFEREANQGAVAWLGVEVDKLHLDLDPVRRDGLKARRNGALIIAIWQARGLDRGSAAWTEEAAAKTSVRAATAIGAMRTRIELNFDSFIS